MTFRNLLFGSMICGMILLISSWLSVITACRNMRASRATGLKSMWKELLIIGVYVLFQLVLLVYYYTGVDPDEDAAKMGVVVGGAAGICTVYICAICIFGVVQGRKLQVCV